MSEESTKPKRKRSAKRTAPTAAEKSTNAAKPAGASKRAESERSEAASNGNEESSSGFDLTAPLHAFITAVQFLTIVPVPGGMNRPGADPRLLVLAVGYFPLVGGLIGLVAGCTLWGSALLWPLIVAVPLALAAEALLTGAFHEDAVADCCDGFGGGWTREDVLRILKDSRVGSFAVVGLIFFLLLRAGSTFCLDPTLFIFGVAAAAAIGRWAIVLLMFFVPPVPKREGMAKDVGEKISWIELTLGSIFAALCVAPCAWLAPWHTLAGLLAVLLVTAGWGAYVRYRLGGITGDCLGCGCYIAQVTFLIWLVARLT